MAKYIHQPLLETLPLLSPLRRLRLVLRVHLRHLRDLPQRGAFRALSASGPLTCSSQTVQRRKPKKTVRVAIAVADDPCLHEEALEEPTQLRRLLIRPVLLSVANYGALALLDIAYRAVQPLFLSTPVALGGLGVSPATIGAVLGAFGLLNGVFQAAFFARIVRRWGPKRVFMAGMAMFVPLFALFPVLNALARAAGGVVDRTVWTVVFVQLMLSVVMDMAYGACAALSLLNGEYAC